MIFLFSFLDGSPVFERYSQIGCFPDSAGQLYLGDLGKG